MRRSERGIKEIGKLEAIIQRAQICRVGLSQKDNPYIVPVHFGYQDNCLYFHCAREGKKIDILRDNPRVCFEMDIDHEIIKAEASPCRWGAKYRSIIGFGTALVIEDPLEKSAAMNIIIGHYGGSPYDFSAAELEQVKIIKIKIDSMSGKQAGY